MRSSSERSFTRVVAERGPAGYRLRSPHASGVAAARPPDPFQAVEDPTRSRGSGPVPADPSPQPLEPRARLALEPVARRRVVVAADELVGRVLLLDHPVLAVVGV